MSGLSDLPDACTVQTRFAIVVARRHGELCFHSPLNYDAVILGEQCRTFRLRLRTASKAERTTSDVLQAVVKEEII
jgi:hypothetical protein